MFIIFLLLLSVSGEVVVLKEGSLEQQTLSKDGFILYYEKKQPDAWLDLIQSSQDVTNITFFEMNCTKYECSQSEFVKELPSLVYSVENSIWEPVPLDDALYDFTYKTFVKSCFLNRIKCKDHELDVIQKFDNESIETIQNAAGELTSRIAELEATFADYYKQLEREFHKKRLEIRSDLEKTEDMINVLNDMVKYHV